MRRLLFLGALLAPLPGSAATIDWVSVGDPGNVADTASNCLNSPPNCGSVGYSYSISKYEVTNAQYAEFLNAKAASDPLALYDPNQGYDGYITQSGSDGSYSYAVTSGFAEKPVGYITFFDALRFANWLDNGQGSGDTETGAYTLLGGTEVPSNGATVTRNSGATVVLTSENEWYKAAYYSPGGVYFDYPTGSDTPTVCAYPPTATPNTANCPIGGPNHGPTDVGAYTGSASPYGTFDQAANAAEWNDGIGPGGTRGARGGCYDCFGGYEASSTYSADPSITYQDTGFRVAMVPEPDAGLSDLLVMTALLGLAKSRRRRSS
jgi:formylglycine-generating enzyme required for sulfatase activity